MTYADDIRRQHRTALREKWRRLIASVREMGKVREEGRAPHAPKDPEAGKGARG